MKEIYNFAAGPATMPKEVLQQAAKQMLNYENSGMSVMEMSHRTDLYENIHNECKEDLKKLLKLNDDYEILFLQGGASTQFELIPLNFLQKEDTATYIDSGAWTKKAIKEAKQVANIQVLASSQDENYNHIPEYRLEDIKEDSKYLYICSNNTIYGTRFSKDRLPQVNLPLIADMSSNIMSEEYEMTKFDLAYAGAQKNLGPSGVTILIVKKSFLKTANENLPSMFNYKLHAEKNSMFNTPPTYNIYLVGLVLKWLKNLGGIAEIEKINKEKAKLLYDFIDNSKIYKNDIKEEDRSLMNVVFVTGDKNLDADFVKGAIGRGLLNLKGHRSVGGMRASIYNAMPVDGVKALIDYMKDFEYKNR